MAWSLRWTGAAVVPILHNALWPEGYRPKRLPRDVAPWRAATPPTTLLVSPAIRRQLSSLGAAAGEKAIEFRPAFPAAEFPMPPVADPTGRPFRILFVGRVEAEKGAFDLVEIAARLETAAPGEYRFDVCGSGSKSAAFAAEIERRGLGHAVAVHGRLPRAELIGRYRDAHVCVVPTRSSFGEGFAQVVAEAILLLRPVVTSPVVPASEPYAQAVELARTDDPASYAEAIARLAGDPERYGRLARACVALRPQILDRGQSFQSALGTLEQRLRPE
jgi:glycosyltransferase involved in cell wall biosynthesis